ncbi:hypothetical protein ABPG74_007834 [Tetrahymena malaccensis]
MQQQIKYQKKCSYHENRYITYLQIGQLKQQQIGACIECIISNELNGENLILINDIQNMINKSSPIQKKIPFLKDKSIISDYLNAFVSQEYYDPQLGLQTFFAEFKKQIICLFESYEKSIYQNIQANLVGKEDLLNTYDQVIQKGKLLTLFQDYMLENADNGQNLSKFIKNLNQNSKENAKILKDKLEYFKKSQSMRKDQQQLQNKLKDLTFNLIQIIGKTCIYDNKNEDYSKQQIEGIQEVITGSIEAFNLAFKDFTLIESEDVWKNQKLWQFIQKNQKDISQDLIKLQQNILQSEIQFRNSANENISNNQLSMIKETINQFNINIKRQVKEYGFQVTSKFCNANNLPSNFSQINSLIEIKPWNYQITRKIPFNNYSITCHNQKNIFEFFFSEEIKNNLQYRVQLDFKPFQDGEDKYTFQIGIKHTQQNNQVETYYFLSNAAIKGQLNTKTVKGMGLQDLQIAHSEQMKTIEFLFCLKNNQFQIQDVPKRENVTIASDERLNKIDLNQKYNFFIKTQNIQFIKFIEFKLIPMS